MSRFRHSIVVSLAGSSPEVTLLRTAVESDADQIAEIYRPFVTDSTVSFEEAAPSADEIRKRIGDAHLWLVDVVESRIRGYAYATAHRSRHAYRFTTETSIYVPTELHRSGIGRPLYQALLDQLTELGFATAVAGITLPNEASIGFHEAMGFGEVGVFPNVGFKFGQWHDTIWMARHLAK